VYDLLCKHNVALCLAESEKLVIPHRLTADFAYFRLRKADYPPGRRAEIKRQTSALLEQGKDVTCFSNMKMIRPARFTQKSCWCRTGNSARGCAFRATKAAAA
jgi:hypothetical protein